MFPRPTSTPAVEPLSLAEALTHLREVADGGANDAYVTTLISTARAQCEARTGRVLISTPFLLTLPGFPLATARNPLAAVSLHTAPVIAVQSVQYLDAAGTLQTLAAPAYKVHAHLEPAVIAPAPGASVGVWPAVQAGALDAVRIAFAAGYGPTSATVPEPLKQWMLCAIQHMYDERGWDVPDQFAPGLINPFRILGL